MSSSTDIEVIQANEANAVARMPADMMLLKMENESIMAVAKAKPREPVEIIRQLQELLDAYPQAADDAIYSKPVGTVQSIVCKGCGITYESPKIDKNTECPNCHSRDVKSARPITKFAEGLSIRAAESIRSIFGYTRLATTMEIIEDGKAKITGVIIDYQAGNITSDERIVSPWYKAHSGTMTRVPEDRFINVTVKSEKSKLRRDIILDNTPNIIKAMFRDACEKKLADLVTPELIEQRIVPAFKEYGISPDQLDKIIGRPRSLGWRETERIACRKILTSLKHEETTARELLHGIGGNAPSEIVSVTLDDLAGNPSPKQADIPATKPGDGEDGATNPMLAQVASLLASATTIKECDQLEEEAIKTPGLTDIVIMQIRSACESRQAELKKSKDRPSDGVKPKNDLL